MRSSSVGLHHGNTLLVEVAVDSVPAVEILSSGATEDEEVVDVEETRERGEGRGRL